ncbi:MAG: hypothetical protein AAGF12_02005, partial [Myxococcota bacterium]
GGAATPDAGAEAPTVDAPDLIAALITIVGFAAWMGFGKTVGDKVAAADSAVTALPGESAVSGGGNLGRLGEGLGNGSRQGAAGAARAGVSYGSSREPSGSGTRGNDPSTSDGERGSSQGIVGFGRGVWDGATAAVTDAAGSVWDAVRDPVGTAKAAGDAIVETVRDPVGTAERAWDATKEAANEAYSACAAEDATAESCGNAVGKAAVHGGMAATPIGAVARGSTAVRIATGRRTGDSGEGEGQATNRAEHEQYRRERRAAQTREDLLEGVEDERLRDLIGGEHGLYRENAQVGSGSTGDAVRHERRTGERVGNVDHRQKAEDGIRAMDRWLNDNPNARSSDRERATQIRDDLEDALYGDLPE